MNETGERGLGEVWAGTPQRDMIGGEEKGLFLHLESQTNKGDGPRTRKQGAVWERARVDEMQAGRE